MKTALVLGAGGFIGSHLVKRLKEDGFWVRGVDLKSPEYWNTYADDFVILHPDKSVILEAIEEIKNFLKPIGLELSEAKCRLTHTLCLKESDNKTEGFDGQIGFNFLGFTIKQFKSKHRSAKATTGEILGFKTLVDLTYYPLGSELRGCVKIEGYLTSHLYSCS
jgi:NAD(P)-dependent dehydrogenase (short-subunit alcohol dehydrogenase family)